MILNRIEFETEDSSPYDLVREENGQIPPQYDVFGRNPIEKKPDIELLERLSDLTESLSKLPAPARAVLLAALITFSPNYNNNDVVYANASVVSGTVPSTPNPYDSYVNPLGNSTAPQFYENNEPTVERVEIEEQVEKEPNYKIIDYVLVLDGEGGSSFEPLDSIDSAEAEIIKIGASSVLPVRIRYRPEGEADLTPWRSSSVHISGIEDHGKLSRIFGYTAAHAISGRSLSLRDIEILGQQAQAKFTSFAQNPAQASRGDDKALLSAWIDSDQIPSDLSISPELVFESIDEAREFLVGSNIYVSGFPSRITIQEDNPNEDVRLTVPAVVVSVEEGFNGMFELNLRLNDDDNSYVKSEFDFSGMSGGTIFIPCEDNVYSVATCSVASYKGRRTDRSSGQLVLAGTTYPPIPIGTNETSTLGWFEMPNDVRRNYDPENLRAEDLVPFMVYEYPQDIEAIGNILNSVNFNLRGEGVTYNRAYLDSETQELIIEFNVHNGSIRFLYNPESKSLEHMPRQ